MFSVLVSRKSHVFSSKVHLDTTYSAFRYHLRDMEKVLIQQTVEMFVSECTTSMGHTCLWLLKDELSQVFVDGVES